MSRRVRCLAPLVLMLGPVLGLALTGCREGAEEGEPPAVAAGAPALPAYAADSFRGQLDAALARAGSVRFRVELPGGGVATGTAELGPRRPAWRVSLDGGQGAPGGYLDTGDRFCVDAAGRALTSARMAPNSLLGSGDWSCVRRPSGGLAGVRELIRRAVPTTLLPSLDPARGFASLGVERVDRVPARHLRVGRDDDPFHPPVDLWLDRSGLPVRMTWTVQEPGGGPADARLDDWGGSVPLPAAGAMTDDLAVRFGQAGSFPRP